LFARKSIHGLSGRIITPDGQTRHIALSAAPVHDHDGNLVRIVGVNQDVTTQRVSGIELTQSRDELRALAQRLQTVREEESARIAREIHDELGQVLTALSMELSLVDRYLSSDPGAAKERLDYATGLTATTLGLVRRISGELRPGTLDTIGLAPAIEVQISQLRERWDSDTEIVARLEEIELDRDKSTILFRVFQELMTNIVRHAEATRVFVSLEQSDGTAVLTVSDNGCGITREEIEDPRSLGLIGMKERCLAGGATISFRGEAGEGTTVRVVMPVD
jgi:signal transduction histidine kinase